MQFYDTSTLGLANPSGVQAVEIKIPLWWSDGVQIGVTGANNILEFVTDGTINLQTTGTRTSANNLFTLNSNWPVSMKFAFEATIWINNASYTSYAALYDFTAAATVSGAVVTTTNTAPIVVRSGQFILVPGRTYGVVIYTNNSNPETYICDASLIVFPS